MEGFPDIDDDKQLIREQKELEIMLPAAHSMKGFNVSHIDDRERQIRVQQRKEREIILSGARNMKGFPVDRTRQMGEQQRKELEIMLSASRRLLTAAEMLERSIADRGKKPEKELHRCYKNTPIDLVPEILSRLPIKSIGRFKVVSKSLHGLITSRRFSLNNPFYTFFGTSSRGFDNLCVVEVSENGDSFRTGFRRATFDSHVIVVGSCNGLLCLAERRSGFDNIVIFNLITNEKTRVNSSNFDLQRCEAHYRFGYNPSANEYKIFRCFTAVPNNMGGFPDAYDILTVGVDKRWRKLSPELFPGYIRHGDSPMIPSCKGTFHWLAGDGDDNFILAFDIAQESTRRIPIPRTDQRYLRLLVSNDPLCLYYREDHANVIWKMEDDGDRWGQIEVPSMLREHSNSDVDFIMSVDCAAKKCGGILFKVGGCDDLGLYCPISKKYTAIRPPRDPKQSNETRLLCELTPRFCSINEIMSEPSN